MATGASVGVSACGVCTYTAHGDMCSPTSFTGFVFDCYGMAHHILYHVMDPAQVWKLSLHTGPATVQTTGLQPTKSSALFPGYRFGHP